MDKYVINQFGKKVDKVLLDNDDGKAGVIVSTHRRNAKAKATTVTAKFCTVKVANRVLQKGGPNTGSFETGNMSHFRNCPLKNGKK